jgi:trehalose 6-phosphate synthase
MMEEFLERSFQKIREASKRAAEKAEKMEPFSHIATRESLVDLVGKKLKGRNLLLVSNREPYAHILRDGKVAWFRRAGGLTVALDSIASACGAVWICHGDSSADFEVTDERGRVQVPPNQPRYALKRIRLDAREVAEYYEGLANEMLWPLCHVCYVRPKFIAQNWKTYQEVNRKFALAIAEEATPGTIVFLQDYHLCLVAKYLKELRSDLTTVLFWHIPWPNPEIFRICPWKVEILEGLLANDILGFHLKYHADNFAQTVDANLECRIDWERMRVIRNQTVTRISAYPISIDFTSVFQQAEAPATRRAAEELFASLRLQGFKIGLGVDRIDYTKGIPERLDAVATLFEKYPEYLGKFTFVQVGVPSRSGLEDYQQVVARIETCCEEINRKYAVDGWAPVIFLKGQQDFDVLITFYQLADVCVVSSLHDGMNLVSKEFVAASCNDRGVLVLSRFTGAARELEQALLVNPYDTENLVEAIHQGLVMPPEEQKARLERMRLHVAENNIYTWAQAIMNDVVHLAEDSQVSNGTAKS